MSYKLLFAALLFILSPMFASAEDAEAPVYARVFFAELEPNSQRAYETVLKKFADAHRQLDTKRYYGVSTQEIGSPTTYTFARIFRDFASMDEEPINVMVKAYGLEQAMEMGKPIRGKVKSQQTGVWVRRLDLSPMQPENATPPALTSWLQVKVKPYGNAAYEDYLRKVAEATNEVAPDSPFVVWMPGPGGNNEYAFATSIASWEAMDQGPGMSVPDRLEAAFGKREAKRLLEARAAVVESQITYISKSRPELSYLPSE